MMVTDFRCRWQNHYVGDFFRYVGDFLNRSTTSWIGHQHIWSPTSVTNIDVTVYMLKGLEQIKIQYFTCKVSQLIQHPQSHKFLVTQLRKYLMKWIHLGDWKYEFYFKWSKIKQTWYSDELSNSHLNSVRFNHLKYNELNLPQNAMEMTI